MSNNSSIINKLSSHARASLATAEKIARTAGSTSLEVEHMLYAILLEKGSVGSTILTNMKLCKRSFEHLIFGPQKSPKHTKLTAPLPLSPAAKKILTDAYALATEFGYPYVGTEHVVYAALDQPSQAFQRIIEHGQEHAAKEKSQKTAQKKTEEKATSETTKESQSSPANEMHTAQEHSSTMPHDMLAHVGKIFGFEGLTQEDASGDPSALDQFTYDMADHSRDQAFIGYSDEVRRVVTILGRRTKNNPLLVGEPGVGKTALVEHIARIAVSSDAPLHLRGKHVRALDLALLVAGTTFRGEFEQRLKDVITEASERSDVILFIDEIHTIVGAGNAGGNLDAANILKPSLARGELHVIGATTHKEYKTSLQKDAALARRFGLVALDEPSTEDAIKILSGAKKTYEDHHSVHLTPETIRAAVELSVRYVPEQHLPDKAFDLLDETCARLADTSAHASLLARIKDLEEASSHYLKEKNELLRTHDYDSASALQLEEHATQKELLEAQKELNRAQKKSRYTVTIDDLAETVSAMTGVPKDVIQEKPLASLSKAHTKLQRAIIGQNEALAKVISTLSAAATGVTSYERPRGSFLFLGPTGVGKTLTASVLAREVFGSDDALIRIDMSELGERHSTAKLLGAPAGYVGYGEGGTLTEKVRKRPYSVVLFDEIEKAHPDACNILLQILEDGRLTDSEGTVADFRNTIIVLTSNIGNHGEAQPLGFTKKDQPAEKNIRSAKELLPPELLARLDHVLPFTHLDHKMLGRIATIELRRLKNRMATKNIVLEYPQALSKHIAQTVTLHSENARAVRKVIQKDLQNTIAEKLISTPETSHVRVAVKKDSIHVTTS